MCIETCTRTYTRVQRMCVNYKKNYVYTLLHNVRDEGKKTNFTRDSLFDSRCLSCVEICEKLRNSILYRNERFKRKLNGKDEKNIYIYKIRYLRDDEIISRYKKLY